jgi:type I restriction enzyme S subunit
MFTSQVNGFAFPLPPCEEQSLIVARVQKALRFNEGVAAVVSDNTDAANNLDRSVLARAFRGELVPQDPSDEPASVLLERIRQEREQQRHRGRNS